MVVAGMNTPGMVTYKILYFLSAFVCQSHCIPEEQKTMWPDLEYSLGGSGQFDAGARFNSYAPASIPPPPPGVAPNVAQAAAAQGHQVVTSQKKGGFFKGSGSGGYTFW